MMSASGSFRRWERFVFVFIGANFLVIPLAVLRHPSAAPFFHGLVVPGVKDGFNSTSVLLIMAIVGTTVAPWQLFFQQSNIVDKRITPRWINYERVDTVLGSLITVLAASVMMAVVAVAFAKTPLAGHFVNAGTVSERPEEVRRQRGGRALCDHLAQRLDHWRGLGDPRHVLRLWRCVRREALAAPQLARRQVLLRRVFGTVVLAAGIVIIPHAPLGLITTSVQALAGVLLPSATVLHRAAALQRQ